MSAKRATGFTLLELIMTIVLFAIVSVMVVSFFGAATTKTFFPVQQLQADATLQLTLENMIADKDAAFSSDLNGLSTKISTGNQTTYGNGTSYYVIDNHFVCPNATNVFVSSAVNQFLLVTIASNATSGVHLSYLFNVNSSAINCNAGGS